MTFNTHHDIYHGIVLHDMISFCINYTFAHIILDLCHHEGNQNISGPIPTEIGLIESLEYLFIGESWRFV